MRYIVTKRDLEYLNQNICVLTSVVFKNTDNIVFPICPSHTTLVFFGALSLQPHISFLAAPWYRVKGLNRPDFSCFPLPFSFPSETAMVEQLTSWVSWQPTKEPYLPVLFFLNISNLSTFSNSPSKDLNLSDSLWPWPLRQHSQILASSKSPPGLVKTQIAEFSSHGF